MKASGGYSRPPGMDTVFMLEQLRNANSLKEVIDFGIVKETSEYHP